MQLVLPTSHVPTSTNNDWWQTMSAATSLADDLPYAVDNFSHPVPVTWRDRASDALGKESYATSMNRMAKSLLGREVDEARAFAARIDTLGLEDVPGRFGHADLSDAVDAVRRSVAAITVPDSPEGVTQRVRESYVRAGHAVGDVATKLSLLYHEADEARIAPYADAISTDDRARFLAARAEPKAGTDAFVERAPDGKTSDVLATVGEQRWIATQQGLTPVGRSTAQVAAQRLLKDNPSVAALGYQLLQADPEHGSRTAAYFFPLEPTKAWQQLGVLPARATFESRTAAQPDGFVDPVVDGVVTRDAHAATVNDIPADQQRPWTAKLETADMGAGDDGWIGPGE